MPDEEGPSLQDAAAAAWDAAAAAASGAPPPEAPAPAPAEAAPAPVEPPDDYDEKVGLDRDTWKAVPEGARGHLKTLAQQRAEAEERAKRLSPLDDAVAEWRDQLRAEYGTEAEGVRRLMQLSDWATRDPTGFIQHLARQRGIDMRAFAPQPQQPADPAEQIRELARREALETLRREKEATAQAEVAEAVRKFNVNPEYGYRHDPDVRKIMANRLMTGEATSIDEAYNQATQAVPAIAAKLAEARAKQEEAERAKAAAEKARAAASVRGAPGTTRPVADAASEKTVQEIVAAAYDAAARG